jgi:hypothetical protein
MVDDVDVPAADELSEQFELSSELRIRLGAEKRIGKQ